MIFFLKKNQLTLTLKKKCENSGGTERIWRRSSNPEHSLQFQQELEYSIATYNEKHLLNKPKQSTITSF